MRSGEENGFIHGVAHCVSTLVEDHMEDAAWRIIQRTEFDVFAFIDAGVEQDELLAIKYLFTQYGRYGGPMNEQIEMYRAVQDRRGEWRISDPIYSLNVKEYGFVSNVRPDGDIDVRFNSGWTCDFCKDEPTLLWLPPSTPRWPGDDNRNLWDMVDWSRIYFTAHRDGTVSMFEIFPGTGRLMMQICHEKPLPEALLRAIAEKK